MYEVMESLGINYMLYEGVIIVLLLLIGGLFGAVIAGRRKEKASSDGPIQMALIRPAEAGHLPPQAGEGFSGKVELPTIGSVRHGQKVTICGAEWTIM